MQTENIQKQIEELKQKPQLTRKERRYLAKLERKIQPAAKSSFNFQSIGIKLVIVLVIGVIIWAVARLISAQPNLPPIDLAGHIEDSPPSHILDQPMPELIQKHMLEHADGEGMPGVIIQYNCKKYSCEKGLVDRLKSLVKKYPDNVYLAPGDYDGKIILTKLGKREILGKFDEKNISDFINL